MTTSQELIAVRPGTFTVTTGNRSVTLDPLDDREKFDKAREEIDRMLAEIKSRATSQSGE